jgi:hypothetical protein
MNNPARYLLLALTAGAAAAMAVQGGKALFVNGKKSSVAPIDKGKETFVPLSALKAGGASVTVEGSKITVQFGPMAGRDERPYIEGVLGDYVQNEAWKIKVANLQEIVNPFGTGGKGYTLDVEIRNLLSKSDSMHGSGLDGPRLIDVAGNSLAVTMGSFPGRNQVVEPGGSFTNTLKFGPTSAGVEVKAAEKVIFDFRAMGKAKAYKAIRIKLNP